MTRPFEMIQEGCRMSTFLQPKDSVGKTGFRSKNASHQSSAHKSRRPIADAGNALLLRRNSIPSLVDPVLNVRGASSGDHVNPRDLNLLSAAGRLHVACRTAGFGRCRRIACRAACGVVFCAAGVFISLYTHIVSHVLAEILSAVQPDRRSSLRLQIKGSLLLDNAAF